MYTKLRLVIAVTVAGACISAPVAAQKRTPERRVELSGPARVSQLPASSRRWALVVGVDTYDDEQITGLRGAANDARALAGALVANAGFPADQVILLATGEPGARLPTRGNILQRLSNLAAVVPKDGLLLVSFSGHGIERGGQAFLLPSDARAAGDVALLEDTAISVARMRERIRATKVGQVIVLLDACRNDPVSGRADSTNPMTAAYTRGFDFDVANREVEAFATIYATSVGDRAYEYAEKRQGYFTWAVVEGLRGAAAGEDGRVTLAGLVRFVQEAVPKRIGVDLGAGKRQKPFATIEGYRADELVVSVGATVSPGPEVPAAAAVVVDPKAVELELWAAIKESRDAADYEDYLKRYPGGTYEAVARAKIKQLRAAVAP
ncbi:MAG: caspase family protein, partial [Acidobacteria bacterium]|nr:caspase family protein [Acidobacteriota bacterium]